MSLWNAVDFLATLTATALRKSVVFCQVKGGWKTYRLRGLLFFGSTQQFSATWLRVFVSKVAGPPEMLDLACCSQAPHITRNTDK